MNPGSTSLNCSTYDVNAVISVVYGRMRAGGYLGVWIAKGYGPYVVDRPLTWDGDQA